MPEGPRIKAKTHPLKSGLSLHDILKPSDVSGPTATKVVFTMGPSCHDVDTLCQILEAGASCARVDLSWAPLAFHLASLNNLQEAMMRTHRLCAIMLDVRGREIQVVRPYSIGDNGWPVHNNPIPIKAGDRITLTTRPDAIASEDVFPVSYDQFHQMTVAGDTVYLGRYLVSGADAASLYLKVVAVEGQDVTCEAENEALLEGLLTVYHAERAPTGVQNKQNKLPVMTEADLEDLAIVCTEFDVDFLALAYCRSGRDVQLARAALAKANSKHTKVVAKIETRSGLCDFKAILQAADAVMMSRGNLGLDCAPSKVTMVQKNIVSACNMVGKPIVLTRVVDTMVTAPRPTRAEATDVANAVLDGVDAILLGAETVRGVTPVLAVTTVLAIAREAEKVFDHDHHFEHLMSEALRMEEHRFDIHLGGTSPSGLSPGNSSEDLTTAAPSEGPSLPHSHSNATMNSCRGNSGLGGDAGLGGLFPGEPATPGGARARSGLAASSHRASTADLGHSIAVMTRFGAEGNGVAPGQQFTGSPYLSKLESIASSACKAADKTGASLIVVFTSSGKTASLVAKYRPPMPVLALVVPQLAVSGGMQWQLQGKHVARQCTLLRGVIPLLAAPSPDGERVLAEAFRRAGDMQLLKPGDYVVVVQRIHLDFCVKIVQATPALFTGPAAA